MSSFHLHIFLCICLQSTETTVRSRTSHSGTSSFRFIPNNTLVLVRNFILVSCKLKITKSCSLKRVAHEHLMWRENHASDNALAEPFGFIMWRQCELHSGTKLNPEWKSFCYHINSNPFNYRATEHCNGQWTKMKKTSGNCKITFQKK